MKLCVEQNLRMDGFYKYLRFKDKEMILNNGTAISSDLLLFDENSRPVPLSDLVASNRGAPKMIIRLSAFACDICLDEEVKVLSDFAHQIGKENIIIFASNYNIRSLKVRKNNLSINLPFYRLEETGIRFETTNSSLFIFLIDTDFIVKDFFIPEKTLPELSRDYYSTIVSKYYE